MESQRRPYRSHKVPACDRCRRFKRRCTGGTPDRPCVLCGLQNVPCVISGSPKAQATTRRASKRANQRRLEPTSAPAAPSPPQDNSRRLSAADREGSQDNIGPDYHGSPDHDRSKVEMSMVASPVISEDIQILERYMSSKANTLAEGVPPHAVNSAPSVYLRVPRRREGLAISQNPGKQQKEILMQILQPYADELVRLYVTLPRSPKIDQLG